MDEQQQRELADLIADDERHAAAARKAADYDALMARAEAAEAELARLQDENAETWFAFDRQQERSNRLAARVAELEAASDAQGWRPVTEKPERTGCYYLCATVDDMAPMQVVWYTPDGTWYVLPDERVLTNWQPLPPPPTEEE
jgi:hypothetical protein